MHLKVMGFVVLESNTASDDRDACYLSQGSHCIFPSDYTVSLALVIPVRVHTAVEN
jgi:hypothetical protein